MPNEGSGGYDSHVAFYQDVFGHAVTCAYTAGRTGAWVMDTAQTAGDWSDLPTPDLVISKLISHNLSLTFDVGAGKRQRTTVVGDFLVVPPHCATIFLMEGVHAVRHVAVPYQNLLELAGPDAGLPRDGDFGCLHAQFSKDVGISDLIDRLMLECGRRDPQGALWADGALLQLSAALLRLREKAEVPRRGGLAPWQLKRLTDYLGDHLEHDVGLQALARLVDLSPEHLCRAFKRSTGLAPYAWLMRMRIRRAQELMLADRRIGLTEIAVSVGYSGQAAFGTAFRRVVGVTPSQWRRERC